MQQPRTAAWPAEAEPTFGDAAAMTAAAPLAGRRVLIIVENLPVPFDRRVWQEARALKAAGATVSVISPMGKGYEAPEETIEGINVYRHPLPAETSSASGYLKEYAAALWHECRLAWKVFRKHGFDVIHGCNPPDLIFLVALPYLLLGRKFIFDHHDINPELYEAKFARRDLFWRLLRLAERLTFATATVSIATNDSYRRIAIERGGMKPDRVFVVRSGPDLTRLKDVQPNPSLRRGRAYLVGYVGVMGEQEGIDLLIAAVGELVHQRGRNDIQFCLVGGGPSLPKYEAMAEARGLRDQISFLGRAPDKDLFEVLSTADLCVNPDRVNAMNDLSTMNKILEYMAMGKPIVQFDVVEGRVSAGEASLYAKQNDPADLAAKIEELLADPERRERMGRFGQARVAESLSWNHQTPQLIAAYKLALRLDARA
jgi:glycosyltransferase involved in cell wall biosynthesis